jgi:carboxymethylenebutenolidase
MIQTRLDLPTKDGILDVYLFQPEGAGVWPAVVFYMDAFGIRQELFGMAERLASHGYVVAMPNLYYRSGDYAPFDQTQVAAGGAERDRFKGMIASIDNGMVMGDTQAILASLALNPSVRAGAKGVVGYCMGGGFALAAAGTFPTDVAAAAAFHAGSLATARPDSAHLMADRIRATVYIGAAAIDPSFSDDQRQRLEAALQAAGVTYMLEVYGGARHGFAVSGHLVYDREASERHWATLVQLFADTIQDRRT